MPDPKPFDILVLGPMALKQRGMVASEPRTRDLKRLVESVVADIQTERGPEGPAFRVVAPDDRTANVIVPGILDLIEQAELVIIDLSHGRPNVTYEAALVHALGLPHVLITEDRRPPFYFQPVEHIAGFRMESSYHPELSSHAALRRKILDAATKPGAAADFARNQITAYFDVPIVDIAGPSGLAAGYYANCIHRFVRPGGFFHKPRRIVPPPRAARGDAPAERTMRIEHYFAVSPPGGLTRSQSEDAMELEQALASWGLRLHFVTIQRLPDDDEDMRDFGASLLGRDGELVEPAVVLEIPSTLYALQYAPRMRRLEKRVQDGIARQVVDVLRERHLKTMLESFAKNMNFQIDHDKRKGDPNRFHMVTLGELGDALRAIGVTG